MARISLHGVDKRFDGAPVVEAVDLAVDDGSFCVLVGPSGSGKSTLLRLIAGLEEASAGEIRFDGERVDHLPPGRRGVAMVFQSYALYPHMSVRDNIAFGLRRAGADRAAVAERIAEVAHMLRIEDLLDRKPRQLSGGQQQRVAIGRAVARRARVYLFDEPLSNLDAGLRVEMRLELQVLHRRLGATFVYVTHDQIEAMTLADRMVVLENGRIAQAGAPMDVYRRPETLFVGRFIGSPQMNVLDVTVVAASDSATTVRLSDGEALTLAPRAPPPPAGTALRLGVRADDLLAVDDGALLRGAVAAVERIGNASLVHVRIDGGGTVVTTAAADAAVAPGDRLGLAVSVERTHLFAADGRALPAAGG